MDEQTFLTDAVALGSEREPVKVLDGMLPFSVLPPDYHLQSQEGLLLKPSRIRQNVTVLDADSFVTYFTDYVQPASRIFVDMHEPMIIGVLDYHQDKPTAPEWGSHRVTLKFTHTREWKTWVGGNKKEMNQAQFASFVEENLPDIVEPSHADMVTVSRTLEVKKGVNFSSSTRLDNGEVQFAYEEDIRGTVAKGTLEVPETFKIKVAPFEPGLPPYPDGSYYVVTVRLRYRIRENGLTLWYEMVRPHKIIEDAIAQIVLKIKGGVSNPITLGGLA